MDWKHLMRFQSETSVFSFLRYSVNGKHLMRSQSETSVFKFLRRSANGEHLIRFQSETSVFKFLRRSVDLGNKPANSVFIPQSLVLRSIVLGWGCRRFFVVVLKRAVFNGSLNFRKFKVALNLIHRIALNVSLNLSIYYFLGMY